MGCLLDEFTNSFIMNDNNINGYIDGKELFNSLKPATVLYSKNTEGSFSFNYPDNTYIYIQIEYAGACGNRSNTNGTAGKGAKSIITLESISSFSISNGVVGTCVISTTNSEIRIGGTGKTNGSNGSRLSNVSPATYAYGGGGSTGFDLSINGGSSTSYEASGGGGNAYTRGRSTGNGGKGGGSGGGTGGTSSSRTGGNATDGNNGYNEFEYDGVGWIKITGYDDPADIS